MRGRKPDYESLLRGREAMSIQRYEWSQWGNLHSPSGGWVTYADHVAAVAEAERQVLSRLGEWQKHSPLGGKTYAQGYAAGLDAARDAVAASRRSPYHGVYEQAQSDFRTDALAAIDALRGDHE